MLKVQKFLVLRNLTASMMVRRVSFIFPANHSPPYASQLSDIVKTSTKKLKHTPDEVEDVRKPPTT